MLPILQYLNITNHNEPSSSYCGIRLSEQSYSHSHVSEDRYRPLAIIQFVLDIDLTNFLGVLGETSVLFSEPVYAGKLETPDRRTIFLSKLYPFYIGHIAAEGVCDHSSKVRKVRAICSLFCRYHAVLCSVLSLSRYRFLPTSALSATTPVHKSEGKLLLLSSLFSKLNLLKRKCSFHFLLAST